MKVVRHGNKYQISYRCPSFPKLINESFDSEEEAELRLAQIKLEKKRGTLTPPSRYIDPDAHLELYRETITVSQLMDEYVTLYGLNHWSEGTLSCNLHRIKDYIVPFIGDIPIKTLTTHRLEEFYKKLLTLPAITLKGRESENKNISPSVVEKVHALIRNALNQALRWDYLRGVNPANAVELPRYKKQVRDVWTETEARQALKACTDPVLRLCILLSLGCSMRIGEILGLTWDCVHIDDDLVATDSAYLYVEKELRRCDQASLKALQENGRSDVFLTFPLTKENSPTVLVLKTPKTESSVRTIYIPATVIRALKEMRTQQLSLMKDLGPEYDNWNLVIAYNNGHPVEEHAIAAKLKRLIKDQNLRPVVFHSLRHSSTSIKLKLSGGDIKAVQGDTGHTQSNMVTDVYSHIMHDDRKRLAQRMDQEFFSAEEKKEKNLTENASAQEAMRLLQSSPEMAELFLKMANIFSGK